MPDNTNDLTPSERITNLIAELGDWRGDLLRRLRALILAAEPALVEAWKWDTPVWSHHGDVVAAGVFKEHVKLNFFKGAALDDPDSLFNASLDAKNSRAIDFQNGDTVHEPRLTALVRAAVEFNASRQKPSKR